MYLDLICGLERAKAVIYVVKIPANVPKTVYMNEFFIPTTMSSLGLDSTYLKTSRLIPLGRNVTCPAAKYLPSLIAMKTSYRKG